MGKIGEKWQLELATQWLLVTLIKFFESCGEKNRIEDPRQNGRGEVRRLENSLEEHYCQLQKINRVLAVDKNVMNQEFVSNWRNNSMLIF